MIQFILQHEFWAGIALYWIFSAAVSSMPEPQLMDSPLYKWAYGFLHTIAGNIFTAFGSKIPGIGKIAPMILLTVMLVSCHGYLVHPGAPTTEASQAYDTLVIVDSAIQTAKSDFKQGLLPSTMKPKLNSLIHSYNLAVKGLKLYSDAVKKGQPFEVYLSDLVADIADVEQKVKAFKGGQ